MIDCHTHLVYGGNRSDEFEMRLNGMDYQEIAKRGGGILSTVQATRESSIDELYKLSLPRFKSLIKEGVGTIEIKSGYGLGMDADMALWDIDRPADLSYLIGQNHLQGLWVAGKAVMYFAQ